MKKKKEEVIDTKLEFLKALDNIVKEKNIDKAVVIEAMELALTSAYKKHYGKANGKAKVNPETGDIKVYSYITVVEEVVDPETEISLEDAKKIRNDRIKEKRRLDKLAAKQQKAHHETNYFTHKPSSSIAIWRETSPSPCTSKRR